MLNHGKKGREQPEKYRFDVILSFSKNLFVKKRMFRFRST